MNDSSKKKINTAVGHSLHLNNCVLYWKRRDQKMPLRQGGFSSSSNLQGGALSPITLDNFRETINERLTHCIKCERANEMLLFPLHTDPPPLEERKNKTLYMVADEGEVIPETELQLVITTTEPGQIVNIGHCLGVTEGEAITGVIDGVLDWGDSTEAISFTTSDTVDDTKFQHEFAEAGTYTLIIKGQIRWGDGTSELEENDIRNILQEIHIPFGYISPIYHVNPYGFSNTSQLTSISSSLFYQCLNTTDFNHCFYKSAITSIPYGLFDNCVSASSFESCFENCEGLTYLATDLFDRCTEATIFTRCFYNCVNIASTVPKLWRIFRATATAYADCYGGCTNIKDYNQIPEEWGGPVIDGGAMQLYITIPEEQLPVDIGPHLCTTSTAIPEIVGGVFDWGDDSDRVPFTCDDDPLDTKFQHNYAPGDYIITVCGKIRWTTTSIEAPDNDVRNFITKIDIPEGKESPMLDIRSFGFAYCKNLISIPSNLFGNCELTTSMIGIFEYCSKLESIPHDLFAKNLNVGWYSYCFQGCYALTEIPPDLFSHIVRGTNFDYCFAYCRGISEIPEGLLDACSESHVFWRAFRGCSGLITVPENLFEKCVVASDFEGCFQDCTAITSNVPRLWESHAGIAEKTDDCFAGCEQAANWTEIPAAWGGPA